MTGRDLAVSGGLLIGILVGGATSTAAAGAPPVGGGCHSPWVVNTTLVNPENPSFFDTVDRNGDGVICIKDWTGPDPDPDIGFLAIDNTSGQSR